MTDLRTAAQQALELLKELQGGCTDSDDGTVEALTVWCPEVIENLEAALEQPEQPEPRNQCGETCERAKLCATCARGLEEPEQEPVAWWIPKAEQFCIKQPGERPFAKAWEPLFTHPPRRVWQGLTEEEFWPMLEAEGRADRKPVEIIAALARAIEAALKERNA
jgi:hypothetical protein